jgi:uracil-DNA glycosylase
MDEESDALAPGAASKSLLKDGATGKSLLQVSVAGKLPLQDLVERISACRYCQEQGWIAEARPVFQLHAEARIGIFSQAPGNRAHKAGIPFLDPSGDRLRQWLAVSHEEFYDPALFAIVPMGFCFPGHDKHGGDLPPLKVCAEKWRQSLMEVLMNQLDLILLVGSYSHHWHLPESRRKPLTATVAQWREVMAASEKAGLAVLVPLPHPSWRNNGWLRMNPWFEAELLPVVRQRVRDLISQHR